MATVAVKAQRYCCDPLLLHGRRVPVNDLTLTTFAELGIEAYGAQSSSRSMRGDRVLRGDDVLCLDCAQKVEGLRRVLEECGWEYGCE